MQSSISQEPDWIIKQRESALSKFRELSMPKLNYGISIKIDLEGFKFENCLLPDEAQQNIVCPKDIEILDFYDTVKKHPLIAKKLFSTLNSEFTKFDAFHVGNWKKTTVIILPKDRIFSEPLYIETMFKNSNVENLLIFAEPNSSATILDIISNNDNDFLKLNSRIVEIFAGENSKINFLSLQNCDNSTVTFSIKNAITENFAVVNWMDCNIGSKICISATTTSLEGDGSTTNNYSIFFGSNNQKFDIHSKSIHIGKNSSSDMLTKGILDDYAKAIYRGLLKIMPSAQGSNAYQKEEVTLLSPTAEADSIPELRINNKDIKKCTHGASIGKIDVEKMFYLMSRGFTKKDAAKKIIEGFFSPILKAANNDKFSEQLQKLIENKFDAK